MHITYRQNIPLFFAEAIVRMSIVRHVCRHVPYISPARIERFIVWSEIMSDAEREVMCSVLDNISFAVIDNDDYVFTVGIKHIYEQLSKMCGLAIRPNEVKDIRMEDLFDESLPGLFDIVVGIPPRRPLIMVRRESPDIYDRLSTCYYTGGPMSNLSACYVEFSLRLLKGHEGSAYLLMQDAWGQTSVYSRLRLYLSRVSISSRIYDFDDYPIDGFTPRMDLSIFCCGNEREFVRLVCGLESAQALMSFLLHPREEDVITAPIEKFDSRPWHVIGAKSLEILQILSSNPVLGEYIRLSSSPFQALITLYKSPGRFIVETDTDRFFHLKFRGIYIDWCDDNLGIEGLVALFSSRLFSWYYSTCTGNISTSFIDKNQIMSFPAPDIILYERYRNVLKFIVQIYLYYTRLMDVQIEDRYIHMIHRHIFTIMDYLVYELYFYSHMKQNGLCVFDEVQHYVNSVRQLDLESAGKLLSRWYLSIDNPVREKMHLTETRSRDIINYIRKQA